MKEYDKNWAYSAYNVDARKQKQLEEAESRTNLLLQMANNIMDMSARITQLENRLILNAQVTKQLEDRLEQLEANRGKFYAINKQELPKMLENVVKRLDEVGSWLYTHDYAYFQEQDKENESGNSSFEEYEMHHPDTSYVEDDPFDREVPGFDGGIDSSLEREDLP